MEIDDLRKDTQRLENELEKKKARLEKLEDEEESKKLPDWHRHKCIDCGKHRAWRGVYHDGKLTGYICDSCDYEL
jgi:uncharacterized protein CbrC (UPF0167 family)